MFTLLFKIVSQLMVPVGACVFYRSVLDWGWPGSITGGIFVLAMGFLINWRLKNAKRFECPYCRR